MKLIAGTIVRTANGSSVLIKNVDQLLEMFKLDGTDDYGNRFFMFAVNGNGGANPAHIDGVTYQNEEYRAVLDRNITSAIRVNYVVFYIPNILET